MKVSFTGTRKGMTKEQKSLFREILLKSKASLFVHGDCVGADADAHYIALELGIEIHKRPSNHKSRAFCKEGKEIALPEDPLKRNPKIIDDGDILVACPGMLEEELRSGTWAAIRYARKIQRPISILWPDGTIEFENWNKLNR